MHFSQFLFLAWHKKELSSPARMSVSFKYWDECADPEDMEAMWNHPEVRTEWTDAGETEGQRVHLSRDPDGQPYLTQTEMRVAYLNDVSFNF
ncbi:3D-(3,5/4)-trihydroxycyclohexane-1,2-dione hydrolase [Gossypium arboreum]|uniref:3D-(3,5/4)-trihydroxycyclohexane-1,2-dione hydrolase n=1 Tax=Gossypium arboreum TaxID=29729 RepID=A0A0B0P8A6_GOSAR|nr:3D-(3,5/4)-trihydroxycyclohexane-1,2-dione hydrolase [Gossypium arboreum]